MAAQSYEFTGKTVDEAIADGLKTLKLRTDQVDIEVLSKGSRGIFGIGSEPAHVRLTERTPSPTEQEVAPVVSAVATPPVEVIRAESPVFIEQSVINQPPVMDTKAEVRVDTPLPGGKGTGNEAVQETQALQPDEATDEVLTQLAVELLAKMVQLLGFKAEIVPSWKEADDKAGEYDERYLLLDIHGADLGTLIGRRGETLDNIQYLLRLMVNQRLRQWKNIVVDVEQYKARRVTQLTQLAMRMAEQVTASGRAISLEPMPPNERRVVHLALRDHPTVHTESTGDGERRKVNIVAKR